jgi:hypothetical protein
MTMQQETRFRCDRCTIEENLVLQNTPVRNAPPEGWLTLRINEDMNKPLTHLCPDCAALFLNLMTEKTGGPL